MAESWRDVLSAWEGVRTAVDEYRELDDERVLVLLNWSGRGRTSGFDLAQVGWKGANLFHLRNGRVTRLVVYWERERALADLGSLRRLARLTRLAEWPQRGIRSCGKLIETVCCAQAGHGLRTAGFASLGRCRRAWSSCARSSRPGAAPQ
jgi:hypothetical protein